MTVQDRINKDNKRLDRIRRFLSDLDEILKKHKAEISIEDDSIVLVMDTILDEQGEILEDFVQEDLGSWIYYVDEENQINENLESNIC